MRGTNALIDTYRPTSSPSPVSLIGLVIGSFVAAGLAHVIGLSIVAAVVGHAIMWAVGIVHQMVEPGWAGSMVFMTLSLVGLVAPFVLL